nr:MAG: hypothetical protein J07AB56_11950 [Candidatus Nanosalinarum sp. J07AB56]
MKEVAGTAQSMGVTVDGSDAHEFQKAVETASTMTGSTARKRYEL